MEKTTETIEEIIPKFEELIRQLLKAGYTIEQAVREAYKIYPIMALMKQPLADDLVQSFVNAYTGNVALVGTVTPPNLPFSLDSISKAMSKSWASDKLTLSKRLYKRDKALKQVVIDTIKQAQKTGDSNREIAEKIFEDMKNNGDMADVDLPKFVKDLGDVKLEDTTEEEKKAKREMIRKAKAQVARRSTQGLQAGYNEVIKAVEKDNEKKLEKAIEIATQEKARYNAMRIARTETARAYADGQVSRYMDDEDVVAFQWELGNRHPAYDICDFYANADLYGLGKGIFPKDKFPQLPAHPHCMCHVEPVFALELDEGIKAKENIEKGGMAYLETLTEKERQRLLGVHGSKAVKDGKPWMQHLRGWDNERFEVRKPKRDIKRLSATQKGVKIKPQPTNPFETAESANKWLQDNFHHSFSDAERALIPDEVFTKQIEQLSKLNDKYGAIGDHVDMQFAVIEDMDGAIAAVTRWDTPNEQGQARERLKLSAFDFRSQAVIEREVQKAIDDNWSMPVDEDNLGLYTITHEYGHMIHNSLCQLKNGSLKKVGNNTASIIKKLINAQAKAEGISREEVKNKYISEYGQTNSRETFAELFAHYELSSNPNPLAVRLGEWIEKEHKKP